jgi:hypothetical protein
MVTFVRHCSDLLMNVFALNKVCMAVSFELHISAHFRAEWARCSHGENVGKFIHATPACLREVCCTYFPLQNAVRFIVRSSLNPAWFIVYMRHSSCC